MKNIRLILLLSYAQLSFAFQSVDVNQANAEQIALLPGVGVKLAKNIVSYRQKNGRFAEEKDLLQVSGMRQVHLNKTSGLIIFKSRTQQKNSQEESSQLNYIKLSKRPVIELAELEKQVLSTLGLADNWEALMKERACRSSFLPKISLALDYDRDVDLRQKTHTQNTMLRQSADGIGIGLRAAFDLSEIIFHKSELEISNLALKRLEKREKILERIHDLYFSYKKLQESGLKPQESEAINKISLELERIAASLDSMSNNLFSKFQERAGYESY